MYVIFFVLFGLWFMDVEWDARYRCRGVLHTGFELLILMCVILASTYIEDLEYMRDHPDSWWWICCFYMCSTLLWMTRYLHIAVCHPLELARRDASHQIINLLSQVVCVAIAWGLSAWSFDHEHTEDEKEDSHMGVCVLLFICPFLPALRNMVRSIVGGAPLAAVIQSYSSPLNGEFIMHRANEFMMLMLGETVLQLVISHAPEGGLGEDPFHKSAEQRAFIACIIGGSIIAFCMLHAHIHSEPADPSHSAMSGRGATRACNFFVALATKACVTLQVGIGIKVALYDPPLEGTKATEQHRLQISYALFVVLSLQLYIKPLHEGLRAYFGPLLSLHTPLATLCFASRLATNLFIMLIYLVDEPSWAFICVQAGAATASMLFLQAEVWLLAENNAHLEPGHDHGHGHDSETAVVST